jgi:hypothetical protein
VHVPFILCRATRFRWFQRADGETGITRTWGLNKVYIGPACPDHCDGHGQCLIDRCDCDHGYTGSDCKIITDNNPVSSLHW